MYVERVFPELTPNFFPNCQVEHVPDCVVIFNDV